VLKRARWIFPTLLFLTVHAAAQTNMPSTASPATPTPAATDIRALENVSFVVKEGRIYKQ
jgi:hypothetical protein